MSFNLWNGFQTWRMATTASNMSKLRFEIVHFLVILVLILLNVGGCGGQPLSLKSIPKVKRQMPLPSEHTQAPILTQWTVFVGHLGFQSITNQYERRCSTFTKKFVSKHSLRAYKLLGSCRHCS